MTIKTIFSRLTSVVTLTLGCMLSGHAMANDAPLRFGIGMFQPDRETNDATYRPLANFLAARLGRPVQLSTVDTWEGLAKSLSNGETDMALMGPWGYILANHHAGAQVISTILYRGQPTYHALIITHPDSGIETLDDLLGAPGRTITFAFGDKGSTSGYLIPLHYFQQNGIQPERHFKRVLYTKHQAIEMQVTRGQIAAGADYDRNRDAMIAQGMIQAERSKILWQSPSLPNDAFAVSRQVYRDQALVAKLRAALADVGSQLSLNPKLLPSNYTGFVNTDNARYAPIRDAGLSTGILKTRP